MTLSRLARSRRLARTLLWTACVLMFACADRCVLAETSATEKPVQKFEPVLRWVFADPKSLGEKPPTVVGAPRTEVGTEGGGAVWFDGKGDALVFPTNPLKGLSRFTIQLLIRPDPDGEFEQRFFHAQDTASHRVLLELRLDPATRRWALDTYLHTSVTDRLPLLDLKKQHAAGEWTWVTLVYDGATMTHYVGGVKELEGSVRFVAMEDGESSVGVRLNRVNWYKGAIRELRVYDQPLSAVAVSDTAGKL